MPSQSISKARLLLVSLGLAIVTFLLYLPAKEGKYLIYDDNGYVAENANVTSGLTVNGFIWAFTTGDMGNYHPLTWLSHQTDVQLFGIEPGRQHLMNIAFHCANSVLFFLLLVQLTGGFWRSAMVAALFAWHPMHVESVAWIAERKDTLCTLFWILTVMAYVRYSRARTKSKYLLILILFVLALLSKPMAVTLPFVLLLLDYWPLNRIRTAHSNPADAKTQFGFGALVVEKIPMILLSLTASVVTFIVQQKAGAMESVTSPFNVRLANAGISYGRYIWKLVWPQNLAVLYPYEDSPRMGLFVISLLMLLAISAFVVNQFSTKRYLFVGWCWYLGVLVPMIGLVQVGEQSMADRYSYVPSVGLFIAVVFLAADFAAKKPGLKYVFGIMSAVILGAFVIVSHRQIGYWKDSFTLFSHEIEAVPNNAVAEYHLAFVYHDMGNEEESVKHYRRSLELDPNQYMAHSNLGASLAKLGRYQEATNEFMAALATHPNIPITQMNLGASLEALGDKEGALAHYTESLRLKPDEPATHLKLGIYYQNQGDLLMAKSEFQQALIFNPNYADAHQSLAGLLNATGDPKGAIEEYELAIKINPENVAAMNDLAWLRAASADASLRNGEEAVRLAKRACELTQETQPYLIGTLANAYAEAGRFDEAIATAQKAIDKAIKDKLPQVADRNKELMALYKSHQAFHESPAAVPAK